MPIKKTYSSECLHLIKGKDLKYASQSVQKAKTCIYEISRKKNRDQSGSIQEFKKNNKQDQ